jgi:transmembrane sensor
MTETDHASADPEAARQLRQDAWDWVFRITSGEATRADLAALQSWCAQSPRHAQEYAYACGRWKALGPAAGAMLREDPAAAARSRSANFSSSRRLWLAGAAAAAASGVAVMVARPPLGLWPSFSELTADYRTARGEQRQIALAGAASVAMNTQTSLNIRRADGARDRVELISGEAMVSARAQAVEVVAGDGLISATMAEFNIRCDGPDVRVTCLYGLVHVKRRAQTAELERNQQLVYAAQAPDQQDLGHAATVDPEVIMGWRQGRLSFQDEPLAHVIEEINRYRPGRIVLVNDELGRRRYTASFRLDRLNVVVAQLQAALGARVRSLPGGIVLLG